MSSYIAPLGVTSSATVLGSTVYVGGGNGYWYALSASTGAVLWKYFVGSPSQGYYNWASPLLYGGYAYIGVASDCDQPLVRGALLQVSLSSHKLVHAFYVVPSGKVGGDVWSSPSVDAAANTVYITTGDPGNAVSIYTDAVVALSAANISHVVASWQVPAYQAIADDDFGGTPTLFTNGAGVRELAAGNNNGKTYLFDRTHLSKGPVFTFQTSTQKVVAPCAFDGRALYIVGGHTTLGGTSVPGAARALNPTTLQFVWQKALWGLVFAAPTVANGVLAVGTAGHNLMFLDAASGSILAHFSYTGADYGEPVIADGHVYVGNTNGSVYAYSAPAPSASALPSGNGPGALEIAGAQPLGSMARPAVSTRESHPGSGGRV